MPKIKPHPPVLKRRLSPAERERRIKWLNNCFLARGIYFTPKGVAENNRDKIEDAEDLRLYPPAKAMDRLNLRDFDAYISSDDKEPHGLIDQHEMPDGRIIGHLVRTPQRNGFILANWRDEQGRYQCCWLIGGNSAGLAQVLDIIMSRKPKMSFAWTTELVKNDRGDIIDIRIIPEHIAVLGHEGHAPQYDDCEILHITPLNPIRNEKMGILREMVREARLQASVRVLDDITANVSRYVTEVLDRKESERCTSDVYEDLARSVATLMRAEEEDEEGEVGEEVVSVEQVKEMRQQQEEEGEESGRETMDTSSDSEAPVAPPKDNINLYDKYAPPGAKPGSIQTTPLKVQHAASNSPHFTLPPSGQTPAVCASSNTFPSTSSSSSAPTPNNNKMTDSAPTPTDAGAAGSGESAAPAKLNKAELEKKIKDYTDKYTSGEFKKPEITASGLAPGQPEDVIVRWLHFSEMKRNFESMEKKEREDELASVRKELESLRKDKEVSDAAGETRYAADEFFRDSGMTEVEGWDDGVKQQYYQSLTGMPTEQRQHSLNMMRQVAACGRRAFSSLGKRRAGDQEEVSPARKGGSSLDASLLKEINDSIGGAFGGGSPSSSSSSRPAAGSAPAAESAPAAPARKKFDINNPGDNLRDYSKEDFDYAAGLMRTMMQ